MPRATQVAQSSTAAAPRALVTRVLLAINLAVFAVMTALGMSVLGERPESYLRFGANFAPLTTSGEWWRIVSCTFVHFGVLHLAVNLWALWDAGRLVEKLYGALRFAAIFLFAGAAGSLAGMAWNNASISMGASGATFGVLGALAAWLALYRTTVPPLNMDRLRVSASIFVAFSIFYGLARPGIDNAAHIGGLAAGFAMGAVLARPLEPALRNARLAWRVTGALVLACALLPAASLLAPTTTRVYREALALQQATERFSENETRVLAEFQRMVDATRSGQLNDAAAARALRVVVLPAWDETTGWLAETKIDARAPLRADYDLLLQYAAARRAMIVAVAEFLESGDSAAAAQAAQWRRQADEARAAFRERQRK